MSDFWRGYAAVAIIGAAIAAVLMFLPLLATQADGVEISPVACLSFTGVISTPAAGRPSALVLNTCTGKLEWVRIPVEPGSEV